MTTSTSTGYTVTLMAGDDCETVGSLSLPFAPYAGLHVMTDSSVYFRVTAVYWNGSSFEAHGEFE